MVVYLAGGMRSGWQDKFTPIGGIGWVNPMTHGLDDPVDFTNWDLEGISRSDIVLVNVEKDNSRPFGLMLEAGYAKALEKRIILIDGQPESHNFVMVRVIADIIFTTEQDAIEYIEKVQ